MEISALENGAPAAAADKPSSRWLLPGHRLLSSESEGVILSGWQE